MEAERAALAIIHDRFPGHRVLAEEAGGNGGSGAGPVGDERGPVWIVDPLDGTMNFLHDHPMFSSSVGVVVQGKPVVGAIVAAATDERWWAAQGEGAYRNGTRIRTSALRDLNDALIGTGFPFRRPTELSAYLEDFQKVFQRATGIRRAGSAALDLCYVAQGSLDAFWERQLAPWDVAAGSAIIEEAGGRVTRVDGETLDFDQPGSILAANSPEIWTALGEVLRDGPGGGAAG